MGAAVWVGRAAEDDPALMVLITVRSDSFDALQNRPELASTQPHQLIDLPPIAPGSFGDIVRGPARRAAAAGRKLMVEEPLVDALLADIADGGTKDALPLLSFTLERLFTDFGADGDLTLPEYEKLGRIRGAIEAAPPNRVIPTKRTFASLVERARARRREIGAFMRGLDIGKTEPSHLDTHSEASLQGLMEWGARLEMLADSREMDKPDFTQQHRVLDQLESTTEMLVVDVELTLRRYKDRMSARGLELPTLPS